MKLKKLLILVLMSVMATSAIFAQNTTAKTYEIGDIGPGGGIVFCKFPEIFEMPLPDGSTKRVQYLEVSQEDLGRVPWCGCSFRNSCNIQDTTYFGIINTFTIINIHGNNSNYAALLCSQYKTDTTKAGDWWLPSMSELYQIYYNLRNKILANTSCPINNPLLYWSSTQNPKDIRFIPALDFGTGGTNSCQKSDTLSVRAVRAF